MVNPLKKKTLRELWQMRGQVITIALVVACGIAAYVGMASTFRVLGNSAQNYYAQARFADMWAPVRRAPCNETHHIGQLSGVSTVEGRIIKDILLDMPTLSDPAVGHVVSLPAGRTSQINQLFLRKGRLPEAHRSNEVVVSEPFANGHRLELGDTIHAVLNGKREQLRVVGVALSPEFLISLRPGEFIPDDRRWGVLWMNQNAMEIAWQMRGTCNEFTMLTSDGTNLVRLTNSLNQLLAPYGAPGAYSRDRQLSGRYISQELLQLESFATIAPAIFLLVAAFLVNIVLARMLSAQREQLAALKALGYTNFEIALHYLGFVFAVVFLGSVVGIALGNSLGGVFTRMYSEFFRFPVLEFKLGVREVIVAFGISSFASIGGALRVILRAASIPPAEAMRPEAPPDYRPRLLERLGVHKLFTQAARMVLRDMERRPLRTLSAVIGIAFATSIIVVGNYSFDAIEYLLEVQFRQAQREDITIALTHAVSLRARSEILSLPGVIQAEPLRSVPVRLRYGTVQRDTVITGIDPGNTLRRLVDMHAHTVQVGNGGLVISKILANRLGVKSGDVLEAELLDGTHRILHVSVDTLIDDFMGMGAYMQRTALSRLLQEQPTVTEILVRVDSLRLDDLYQRLKKFPVVAGVTRRDTLSKYFRERTAQSTISTSVVLGIFAAIIAVGVVYNSARIALAMRSRELASLRVLGFTKGEVAAILIGEQMTQVLLGLPLGLWLGYWLSSLITKTVDPELFRMPAVVTDRTYATAAVVVLLAGFISAWLVRRRANSLDLIGVLKARD